MSVKNKYNEGDSSPSPLELCIWLGKEHLLHGHSNETKALEQAFLESEKKSESYFTGLITIFQSEVEEALEELSDETTLELEPDFSPEITLYLQTLDNVIYLNHAVIHFDPLKTNDDLRQEISQLVDKVVAECPPTHRLIPLNPVRCSALKGLPGEVHYLFPWYTQWNDMPENSLLLIADRLAGNPVSEVAEKDLQGLWNEMQTDEPLRDQILETATIIKNQPTAMEQAYALRWLLAAKEAEAEGKMPDIVVKAGITGAAIRVAVNTIVSGGSLKKLRFRAGFCGHTLTDEQRVNLLKPTELSIKENIQTNWKDLNRLIEQWVKNEISDEDFSDKIFNGWVHELEQEAQKGVTPLFAEEVVFWLLLTVDNPIPLAAAIQKFDELPSVETLQIYTSELKSLCLPDEVYSGLKYLSSFISDDTISLIGSGKEAYDQWIKKLNYLQLQQKEEPTAIQRFSFEKLTGFIQSLSQKTSGLLKDFASKLENRILKIIDPWEPSLAGVVTHAADTHPAENKFYIDDGEIKVICKWHSQRKKILPYISINWAVTISSDSQLWARFVDPKSNKIFSEVYLGDLRKERESIVHFTSKELNFDPSCEKWAISIMLVEPK